MQTSAHIRIPAWSVRSSSDNRSRTRVFIITLVLCTLASLFFSIWLPLQMSIVTVFLFAGPHNWFEFRYFLTRLPVRFGKSRTFFLTAFVGIGVLTSLYICLALLFSSFSWTAEGWSMTIAGWNSLLLIWLGGLIWLRARQKTNSDWMWVAPVLLAIGALNWIAPLFFSLAIVYLHPLVALWFLDRHLARTRPDWLRAYRRFLFVLPVLIALMVFSLSQGPALPDDNGLFWRITQHSGADLFPSVSSGMLVSVHLFLEMLHYGVWVIALPLIAPIAVAAASKRQRTRVRKIWDLKSVPLARHPRGFPKLIATGLVFGAVVVVVLWAGFSMDYATTRDIYFTVAMAHVLGEAPFLLRTL